MEHIKNRVKEYWTKRAQDFSTVRRLELQEDISNLWLKEIKTYLPQEGKLKILDVGTGAGYFAILLAKEGHDVYGVDLTPAMIEEARKLSLEGNHSIEFAVMDAQKLEFQAECFDVVLARNLTWTLPNPEQAYKEWLRVLKKGGILLNFDADYGCEVQSMDEEVISSLTSGYHIGMTKELQQESNLITNAMDISKKRRPEWDIAFLKELGYLNCQCDREVGARILKERNGKTAPTFLVTVQK